MIPVLLRAGTILDGSGATGATGDLLIEGSRIAAAGRFEQPQAATVVDCSHLVVAPGFIDSHGHSDLHVFGACREKTRQGVTCEVVGNCGFSAFPTGEHPASVREFANGILCGEGEWGWPSARAYLESVSRGLKRLDVASLVGHGSLRIAVAGNRSGPVSAAKLDEMEGILGELLEEGACGFSTGLMYAPGDSAPPDELERLCRAVARHGKIHTSHIRSYFHGLVDAVEEQLQLARATGCRLQISHLQAAGAANWPLQAPAIQHIEEAVRDGVDVQFDCYPYVAGSTVLTQALPQWVLDGGMDAMVARLTETGTAREIAAEVSRSLPWRWQDILISAVSSEKNAETVGKSLADLAEERRMQPVEVMLSLLVEERGAVNMLCFNQSEQNLRQTVTHPLATIISDGFHVKGRPHPRLYGTFPHLLGEFCRQRQWLSLGEAIHKVTAKPAGRFGLRHRGLLAPGYQADVVVFDPAQVASDADYEHPELPPRGIRYVFREGRLLDLG